MRQPARRTVDVLAIDDDRETTDTLADVLTSNGYRISIAEDGEEALGFIQRNPLPRLIILGLFNAGMGGIEFLSYREGSKWEAVPVILLSDLAMVAPLPGWADQVLARPFDPHELLSAVRTKLQ